MKDLKDDVAERLNKTAKELFGIDDFVSMICDETIAVEAEDVLDFPKAKNHPALAMAEIM